MGQRFLEEIKYKIWGKTDPFHPLICHLIDVGCVAQVLAQSKNFAAASTQFSQATECPSNKLINWLGFLSALHDIGKCHPDFQGKATKDFITPLQTSGLIFPKRWQCFRHENFSRTWVQNFLREKSWGNFPAFLIGTAIAGHHGNFRHDELAEEVQAVQEGWESYRKEFAHMLMELFVPSEWVPQSIVNASAAGLFLSGLVVLSDWIASNREIFPISWPSPDLQTYVAASRNLASQAVMSLNFQGIIDWGNKSSFTEVWPDPELQELRPVQRACEQLLQTSARFRLAIIEAPMGEGKTEAALYLATRLIAAKALGGMYIALPTAATSNQMHERVKKFLAIHDKCIGASVKLIHSMAWLIDETSLQTNPELYGEEDDVPLVQDWFRPKKRGLLAPYGVGTVDQALMSALNVKFGFLRLFGLTSKVLVIDEVHAYDAYMSQIIIRLCEWGAALNIPIIMLSATLPAERRQKLVRAVISSKKTRYPDIPAVIVNDKYPLITLVDETGTVSTLPPEGVTRKSEFHLTCLTGALGKSEEIAREVLNQVKNGGCACVIVNTICSAQSIFLAIRKLGNPNLDCYLFHSRFPACRRAEIEAEVCNLFDKQSIASKYNLNPTKRPKQAILVATQVVEQSLDLDFDVMFSEIAPIDLLLQRMGRLHRHPNRSPRPTGIEARFYCIMPDKDNPLFGTSAYVYSEHTLLRTWAVLQDPAFLQDNIIRVPGDVRKLVEAVYVDLMGSSKLPTMDLPLLKNLNQNRILKAAQDARKEMQEEQGLAGRYLLPKPSLTSFTLAQVTRAAYREEDSDAASYFNAKTRIGDDTQRVFLLNGDEYQAYFMQEKSPPQNIIRQIFLRLISVPTIWLKNIDPESGYEAITLGPRWARDIQVIRLQNNRWCGRVRNTSKKITLVYDPELGLQKIDPEEKNSGL